MSISPIVISIAPIKIFQEKNHFIKIGKKLLDKWGIEEGATIKMRIGKRVVDAAVIATRLEAQLFLIPSFTLKEMLLPVQSLQLIVHYLPEHETISFGPVLALLTSIGETVAGEPDFGPLHAFCEEMHHGLSSQGGLFYVFNFKNFHVDAIEGYYFENDGWKQMILPAPDAIYNRNPSRTLELSRYYERFQAGVAAIGIALFNHRFLSKWEIHEMLEAEEHLLPYIPVTKLFNRDNLTEMISEFDSLYLKPINGSQGRNIIQLTRMDDNDFMISSSNSWFATSEHKSLDETIKQIESRLHNNIYLIQQGIPLISIHNRKLDFRLLCHKNLSGRWKVTSTTARISAEHQFVSNIARGGETMRPLKALSLYFDRVSALQIAALMKEVALETATIVGERTDGLTIELGIDIGVDCTGGVWLIEVNSKPSKNFEEHDTKIRPSAKAIIEFATSWALKPFQLEEE
ncbi:glutathione synthetase [Bacillus canaveralius]|uniref:Glutathione synthetase n=1 Tax=Bacillus canaveralius TaxID=1403243 RepID=A0A2N5GJE0_9BACI|nr:MULTISPECIES: YheC/YheD family protein [Bacillus]PLR81184.1 glutathione synthetase [Bacillus canaveralius]PLR86649.1 glutathione synthetase [Bacillus sp. V33-4]PLS00631.1 glutathione synthetase [Bacillus canaveralius]RSK51553.1 YheC/YheD family protein [Bacillus canaveralius]